MYTYTVDALSINVAVNGQAISGTGGTYPTTGNLVDISNAVGPITITVIDPGGGTNNMSIQPVMNTTNSTSGVVNVPAAALVKQSDPVGTTYTPGATTSPGLPATFSAIGATASVQTLGILNELVQRYHGVTVSGASLTHTLTVVYAFVKKYTL